MKTTEEILERLESEVKELENLLNDMSNGKCYWSGNDWEYVDGRIKTKKEFIDWIKGS